MWRFSVGNTWTTLEKLEQNFYLFHYIHKSGTHFNFFFQALKGHISMPYLVSWGRGHIFSVHNYFREKLLSDCKALLSTYSENKKCMQQVEWPLEFIQRKSNAWHFCQELFIGWWIISPSCRQHWENKAARRVYSITKSYLKTSISHFKSQLKCFFPLVKVLN